MVIKEAKVVCSCHGISGSCNMKTCQRVLSEFRKIGDLLHEKYDNAVRVKMERKDTLEVLNIVKRKRNGEYRRDNGRLRSTNKEAGKESLVFTKESPNYCDKSSDFPSTVGRLCTAASYGSDSCENLCCGRGFQKAQVRVKKRCECKFHWCCEIRCKQCEQIETRHTCSWKLLRSIVHWKNPNNGTISKEHYGEQALYVVLLVYSCRKLMKLGFF